MTHSGLATMLGKAARLASKSPTPDAEVPDEAVDKAVEAVKEAVTPVVVAINKKAAEAAADKAALAPEGDDTEVMPPEEFEPDEPVVVERVDDGTEAAWRRNPASYKAKRMLMFIGRIRSSSDRNKLVGIRLLANEGTAARDRIDSDWDAGLVSDAITTLKAGNQFKHPDGWIVFPNRENIAKLSQPKAS